MGTLSGYPNIGKMLEAQLEEVGIRTMEELKAVGSRQAWLKIREIDESACINRLYALEGAIRGIRWHELPENVKNDLKEFYRSFH